MSTDDSSASSPPADSSPSPPAQDSSSTPPSPDSSSTPPASDSSSSPPASDSSSSPPASDSSSSPPSDSSSSPPASDSSSTPPPSDSSSSPPASDSSSTPPPPSPDSSSTPPPDASSSPPPSPPTPDVSSPPPSPPSESAPSESGNNTPPATTPPASSTPPAKENPPPPESNKGNSDNGENNSKSPSKSKGDDTVAPPSKSGDSHSKGSTPQLSDKSGSSHDNESSLIAGAAAGAGLFLLIMIVFLISCATRKKKRTKRDHELKYYRDNSNLKYYNNGPTWQNRPPNDLMMKMPPHSTDHGWAAGPPPPPQMMTSSEMSSAGFSGPHHGPLRPPHPAVALGFNQSNFTYEDLAAATGGFAQSNLLGQGGFGYVHRGVLPSGKEVAVKSLKSNSGQGEREFQAEVDIISRVHHRHLVSLVGWCSTGSQRLLVYEFVPNGTLEYHLHGNGVPTMDWPTRLKIALGSAKGFAYLHEDCHPRIIHRDIKAANILIDLNFEAKVADFGLAKLSSDNHTHVSTRIMGTFGYLAPEYASSGKLTEKSDVYSFGVMLLELITGRRPIDIHSDDDSLVDWARPILTKVTEGGSYEELVDPKLGNNYDSQEMLHIVACAGACIKHSARARPKMSQIVRALEGDVSLEDLNGGSRGSMPSSHGSDSDLKRLGNRGVLSSQEFSGSDETGEFRR